MTWSFYYRMTGTTSGGGEELFKLKTLCLAHSQVKLPRPDEHAALLFNGLGARRWQISIYCDSLSFRKVKIGSLKLMLIMLPNIIFLHMPSNKLPIRMNGIKFFLLCNLKLLTQFLILWAGNLTKTWISKKFIFLYHLTSRVEKYYD